jgi:hypothetical protein
MQSYNELVWKLVYFGTDYTFTILLFFGFIATVGCYGAGLFMSKESTSVIHTLT